MTHAPRPGLSRLIALGAASLAIPLGVAMQPAAATTEVTAVTGAAFGYWATNVSLFGGKQPDTGPTPAVAVAANASNSPQSATATTGLVQYGPATLFSSDAESASTQGSLGAGGSVTSSTDVANINKASTQPSTGSERFTADGVHSTCSASLSGTAGGVTITNGTLVTSTNSNGDPVTSETIASSPAVNDTHTGTINNVGDSFKIVFNEQVANADGSLTVYGFHLYLLGPTAKGDIYVAKAQCGVTSTNVNHAPAAANDSYSTPFDTQLRVVAPGVLVNDSDPDGDALTASVATGPAHGSLSLGADGSFTYQPSASFSGVDSFTYAAKDPSGASSQATASITVGTPPPVDIAVGATGPASVAGGAAITDVITVTNTSTSDAAPAVTLQVAQSGARASTVALATDSGTCTVLKGKSKDVSCALGTIPPGGTATVSVTLAAPKKAGTVTLTATASFPGDPNTANNSATVTTAVG